MEKILQHKICVTTAIIAVCCAGVVYTVLMYKRRLRKASEALHYMNISIVTDEEACNYAVAIIMRRCMHHNAVGFDCEWVTIAGKRQPVALLQLSTIDGFCGLFRLNQMKTVPNSLKALLEDNNIYKIGVSPLDDAKYLFQDYGAKVKSSLDVRHLAHACGHSAGGLASLSEALLDVILDKHWKVRCSDWEAEQLSDRQVGYAAADAHVAIKLFAKLILEYTNRTNNSSPRRNEEENSWKLANEICRDYADVAFKTKHNNKQKTNMMKKNKMISKEDVVLSKRYPHATRSKPLYHNCILQAPDGELLCTCDTKKALCFCLAEIADYQGCIAQQLAESLERSRDSAKGSGKSSPRVFSRYVQKELGRVVAQAPLTVRLRFEPAGRSVGAVGRYYQVAKENKCVVCGTSDSYIRKNVVPREYRKYFPEVMKDHSSHDVVLLCVRCHQRSNVLDLRTRQRLAAQCAAPLASHDNTKHKDDTAKKVRSAARALLRHHSLPEARRRALEQLVRQHCRPAGELTQHLLQEAATLQPDVTISTDEERHGMKVVEYYLKHDGLLRLEECWREHFLASMEPRFMPELWSIKHNEERLRVKFDEGRLSEKDLQSIGLTELPQ